MIKKGFLVFFIFLIMTGIFFYFLFPGTSKMEMPVVFSSGVYDPLIKCKIQGKNYTFHVDLGSCEQFSIGEKDLRELKKTDLNRFCQTRDFKGNAYSSPIYLVQDVQILPMKPLKYEIVQEDPKFIENTTLCATGKGKKAKYHGRIGWPIFKKHVVLFDFPNSHIVVADSIKELEKDSALSLEDFTRVPFVVENGILVVNIETDLGEQKVVLDTGSSFGVLQKNKIDLDQIKALPNGETYYKTNQLRIGDCDFGQWGFFCTDLVNIDGLLGVDFFLEHSVLLDFENQVVYFEKPKGILGTQWKRLKFYIIQFFVRQFSDFPSMENL